MRTAAIFLSIALMGCVTGDRADDVELGMSKAQVIRVMGKPDGQRAGDREVALVYKNRLMSGWSWDRADYAVLLRNDKVVEYGPGEVRQDHSHGTLTIVHLR